ncbi:Claudin-4 [Liparis tanakae]|uniref:Claudin-4 n=1 Tax=Liparis tanakae TaxID=230148 RepID=A0A4Z2G436_9TELE|nr:Claudin-4 [Liparis tanakae]
MLASALCLLGWAGVITSCVLPMWRVTAFVGSTIVTSQTIWEGIWMTCVVQSTGQRSCKPYDSMLALSSDLQAARALVVLAAVTGGAGLVLAFVGGKCTRFLDEEAGGVKGKVAVAAGAVLMVTGLLCLIPTSWAAGSVVKKFYSAAVDAQRREIGASIYIGWGASILLMLGGGLFISTACPLNANDADKSPSVRYLVVRSSNGSSRVAQPIRGPASTSRAAGAGPPRSQSRDGSSTKPPTYARPPWEDAPEPDSRAESEGSSTKSQKKRAESTKSEDSEAPSTKSQLKRAEMEEALSVQSDNDDASSNPARTYL